MVLVDDVGGEVIGLDVVRIIRGSIYVPNNKVSDVISRPKCQFLRLLGVIYIPGERNLYPFDPETEPGLENLVG